jgi:hypothetical protein
MEISGTVPEKELNMIIDADAHVEESDKNWKKGSVRFRFIKFWTSSR